MESSLPLCSIRLSAFCTSCHHAKKHVLSPLIIHLPSTSFHLLFAPQTQQFIVLYEELGFYMNHKNDITGTIAGCLQVELNSVLMQTGLPSDKLVLARNTVHDLPKMVDNPTSRARFSDPLPGICGQKSISGTSFHAIRGSIAMIRITAHMRADLQWWQYFLKGGMALIYYATSPAGAGARIEEKCSRWEVWGRSKREEQDQGRM